MCEKGLVVEPQSESEVEGGCQPAWSCPYGQCSRFKVPIDSPMLQDFSVTVEVVVVRMQLHSPLELEVIIIRHLVPKDTRNTHSLTK